MRMTTYLETERVHNIIMVGKGSHLHLHGLNEGFVNMTIVQLLQELLPLIYCAVVRIIIILLFGLDDTITIGNNTQCNGC